MGGLRCPNPGYALAMLPFALSLGLVFDAEENSRPMLFVILPVAHIPVAVRELLDPFSLHLTNLEVAVKD